VIKIFLIINKVIELISSLEEILIKFTLHATFPPKRKYWKTKKFEKMIKN
jgi:hypothetical protein